MAMFSLNNTILLMSVRAGDLVSNANIIEELVDFLVFATPISLNIVDLCAKSKLSFLLKLKEHMVHTRFIFQQINPSESTEIIDKTNIVFKPPIDVIAGPHTFE